MPAFIDWDVYGIGVRSRYWTSKGSREMNLDTSATNEAGLPAVAGIPILGTGTMHMFVNTALHIIPKFPGALATERGLVAGKIRTVMRRTNQGGVAVWGLIAMQSTLDMTGTNGNAYLCLFDTLSFANRIHIAQVSNNILANYTSLTNSAPNAFFDNVPLALEFEWDASSGTSCTLIVRTGTATDFSNLTVLLTFVDMTSPFITSIAEGLWGVKFTGIPDIYWDNTTIYKRT